MGAQEECIESESQSLTDSTVELQSYRVEIRYPRDEEKNWSTDVLASTDLVDVDRYFLDRFLPSKFVLSQKGYSTKIRCLHGHRNANWTTDDWILQYIICHKQDNIILHEIYCNVYYAPVPRLARNCTCAIC